MNVFNRLLVILADLIVLAGAICVLLVITGAYTPGEIAPTPWFLDRLRPYATLDPTTWNWTLGICIAILVVGLLLLIAELWPGSREPRRLLVKQDGIGAVTVARESVREIADWEAGRVEGVMESASQVTDGSNGLLIHCRLSLAPDASAVEVTQQVQDRVKAAVEHHVGRHVSQVAVDSQLASLSDGRRVR